MEVDWGAWLEIQMSILSLSKKTNKQINEKIKRADFTQDFCFLLMMWLFDASRLISSNASVFVGWGATIGYATGREG